MKELLQEWRREFPDAPQRLFEAFEEVDRKLFLPPSKVTLVNVDAPIPIGYGQTTSQPTTIFVMLKLLNPKPGDKVLEIGTGCGYQTALLSKIVGPQGKVVSIERIPQLYEFAAENLRKYPNVLLILGDGSKGYPKEAPYDGIIVSASTPREVAEKLTEQLRLGGKLVAPISAGFYEEMTLLVKEEKGIRETHHGPFSFVPLIVEEE